VFSGDDQSISLSEKTFGPRIKRCPASQVEVLEGQNVELNCQLISNPVAKLQWFKNKSKVE